MSIEQENRNETSTAATSLLPSFTEYSDFNTSPSNTSGQRRYSQTDGYGHTDNARSGSSIARSSSVTEQGVIMQSQSPPQSNGRTSSVSIAMSRASSATREDSTTRESCGKLFKKILKNGFGWWWWEVSASVLSFISIVLISIFLGKVNGMTLANWNGPVQLNTIISILTTIVRTCLMIPIAACLGQYKWKHFRRPAELQTLQTLDEASRGPWGSLMLVSNAKLWRSITALWLGIVTILALGIEPSAQQILSFPIREARLPNTTAHIGFARDATLSKKNETSYYSSRDFMYSQAVILNAALGSPPKVDFYCPQPATRCSWDDFSTVAICIDTSPDPSIDVSCWNNHTVAFNNSYCNFTPRQNSSSCGLKAEAIPGEGPEPMLLGTTTNQLSYTCWLTCDNSGSIVENFAWTRMPPTYPGWISGIDAVRPAESFFSKWRWCTKTFHNISATPRDVDFNSFSEGPLNLSLTPNPCFIGELCCSGPISSMLDIMLRKDTDLQDLFQYPYDMANFTRNVADTYNSLLRSISTPFNAGLQTLPGIAYYDEVYIQVRWYWLILPVMETVLTGLLLGISIILSRNEPLFKNSVLAYLVYGLEGWEKGEINMRSPESVAELEEVLGRQIAQLGRGEDGLLKLRKE